MKIVVQFFLAVCLLLRVGFAQQQDTLNHPKPDSVSAVKIFELGEITITASMHNQMVGRISSAGMESNNKMEVSRALNMLSGISLTASGPERIHGNSQRF